MMERRRALILPFTADPHNLVDNPLKIPTTCFSSECVKLERQVSWTAIAGCKLKQNDTQQKNGSLLQNRAAMVRLEMARRKPCLILKDVLKTEQGKTYLKRIKHSHTSASAQRESGRHKEDPLVCGETRSNQGEAIIDMNKSITPKSHHKTTPLPSPRQKLRRNVQTFKDNDNKQENIKEMTVDKEKEADYRITEVVDCGLSVSWEPAEDERDCHELSLVSIKDSCTDSEKGVQQNVKRKRKDSEVKCNGTVSPKRHRESVLRLTGEDRKDTGSTPAGVCLEDSREDRCLENVDRSIVQFTVGGDDRTEVLVPIISSVLGAGDDISSPRRRLSLSQKTTSKPTPPEPIVLSSDDEESGDISQFCSPQVQTLVTVEDTVIQGQASQEAVAEQQEASDIQDMQVLRIVVHDLPNSVTVSPTLSTEYSIGIAFATLYCGRYVGKATGNIMIADQKIIIPLKDISERVAVTLTLERKELRRYSVWEQEEMEAQQFLFKGDEEPSPPSVLLLCVSQTAAAAVQRDLCKLCVKQDGTTNTGKASPFILITLRNPLEGMEGALFRSLLDIDCLNSLTHEQSIVDQNLHANSVWECINNPVLSLDQSIDLIRKNGLDSDLMSLLGLEITDSGLNNKEDDPHPSWDTNTIAHIRVEIEPHKDTVLQVGTRSEQDTRTKYGKVEDQKEQELEHPSEKEKEEHTNLYTLCHRRTKESYSVSLCKPSFHWTKFKHQGLTHRLIQFPPPPLKGGITVTMEDLQCLDSGQFLNDVIIDFYLKYLIQNASAAVAERSHIFSSFFYKQLTRRDNASEGTTSDSCQRQRRHQRVRTWTRHVDLFEKDFLFVPVNQESHWYLVLICFPGLEEPKVEALTCPVLQATKCNSGAGELQDQAEAQGCKSPTGNIEKRLSINHNDSVDKQPENFPEESTKDPSPAPVNCTEQTCQKKSICKRPCILIMDSLKLSLHERVFKLLREYLQSEWEARRGSTRDFGPDQMKSSHCLVPLQDNSSDCGLYLLQYVESFLKDPVVHFDLPLHLERWFPRQKVRRKRDEIRDLVLNLYRHQTLEENR